MRLAELASAAPLAVPRSIALTGSCGAGKSSILTMTSAILDALPTVATVSIDAQEHASAHALITHLGAELDKVFSELGVVEERDKVRNALVNYGGLVTGLLKLTGVKVDVSGVIARSAESLRADIARNLEQAGRRVVIVIDHIDRLLTSEIFDTFAALRMYAAIPYVAIMIAVDRHELVARMATAGIDPHAYERLVHIELAIPPADRNVLARVMAGSLQRIGTRTRIDVDPAMVLFDPSDGVGLGLIVTPRDAKRACNALAASLPLLPADANTYTASLQHVLCVLVPELDTARLAARSHASTGAEREALFAELFATVANHPHTGAVRAALRALIVGD